MSKLLLYCTKSKPMLRIAKEPMNNQDRARTYIKKEIPYFTQYIAEDMYEENGKIVAECDFEVEEIKPCISPIDKKPYAYMTKTLERWDILEASCLTFDKLNDYLQGENGYAIHIKNLKERVMELSDCYKYTQDNILNGGKYLVPVDKAPQNMCRVWVYENGKWIMYILISIRLQWLCKILNGEKTIEVRKKVLKEMLE